VGLTDGELRDAAGRPAVVVAEGSAVVCSSPTCLPSARAAAGGDGTAAAAVVAAIFGALGLAPCRFYECLLNPATDAQLQSRPPPPPRLCPVCLRKLASVIGAGFDVALHYRGVREWASRAGLGEEAAWYHERYQVVTERYEDGADEAAAALERPSEPSGRRASQPRQPTSGGRGAGNVGRASTTTAVRAGAAERGLQGSGLLSEEDAPAQSSVPGPRGVLLAGRRGALEALNGEYLPAGSCNGRPAFTKDAGGGKRLFLYFLRGSDSWAVGPSFGDEAVWADCGPAGQNSFAQTWRVWDGRSWCDDPHLRASVQGGGSIA